MNCTVTSPVKLARVLGVSHLRLRFNFDLRDSPGYAKGLTLAA